MAVDYRSSLQNLRSRRLGTDRDPTLVAKRSLVRESYERRASVVAIQYALGGMQRVDPDYTQTSKDEADRVAAQLSSGLPDHGTGAEYQLQGSVPADVHIRAVSDVDLLVLHHAYFTYDRTGVKANEYTSYPGPILSDVIDLRKACEAVLKTRYWGAKVDTSGNKSIALSEGSFRRKVDVVPSCWSDTATYQSTGLKQDRGVRVLDNSGPALIDNLPFKHIAQLDGAGMATAGGTKMAIRLMKNIKNDSDQDIDISSYELASLGWNCPTSYVTVHPGFDLVVLAGLEQFLRELASDYDRAMKLRTPDGSRNVLESVSKFASLIRLSQEVSALADAVVVEFEQPRRVAQRGLRADARKLLTESYIPV